jgi:PAS domain-containing protein
MQSELQTLLHTDSGKHVMDDIRAVTQAMDQEQRGFLQLRWDQQQLYAQREHRTVFFGSVTSMLFITLALIMFTREQERHKKVSAHLRDMEQAQRALRESEAISSQRLTELLLLYDTAPVGLGFVDPDLRFVKVNETLAKFNGKPMAEHIGRALFDVLPEDGQRGRSFTSADHGHRQPTTTVGIVRNDATRSRQGALVVSHLSSRVQFGWEASRRPCGC